MGVPKFYRYLSERYPLVNQAIDESTLLPEIDNLYLDMNGLVHNATHGNEGITKKLTDKDIMLSILGAVDHAMKLTKPRKLLMMAVDGVAPRAKMNQQRSRRFRAARDMAEARVEAAARGEEVKDEDVFDSNCITPGTEFMTKLSAHMQYFIRRKLKEDPLWQAVRIIFSGHEVPGEGEHKIVEYIRTAKMQPGWNPNTRHCMAGLDADLVMLALATHEPHFTLLREQVDFNAFKQNKFGTKTTTRTTTEKKWQLLHIGLLREYLEIDMRPTATMPFAYDGERVIDDFVLITALCGNDFLPHLPSLDIGEGAVDLLLKTYRAQLPGWGDYLTDGGLIAMERLQSLLVVMGNMEEEVFTLRAEEAAKFAKRKKRDERKAAGGGGGGYRGRGGDDDSDLEESEIKESDRLAADAAMLAAIAARAPSSAAAGDAGDDAAVLPHPHVHPSLRRGLNEDERVMTDDEGRVVDAPPPSPAHLLLSPGGTSVIRGGTRQGGGGSARALGSSIAPPAAPSVSFKERYYFEKFGIAYGRGFAEDDLVLASLVRSFAEALQWVMLYYYRGVPSWGWFYPFHYSPMTSDLIGLADLHITFRLGSPFLPFQQLLGCLPAASGKFLPLSYRNLMQSETSPLISYYPNVADIKVDMNGKRNPWEGVTLIPFIKENEMLEAIDQFAPPSTLSAEERKRNSFGVEFVFEYDPTAADTVPSSMPGVFPPIHACGSRAYVLRMPSLPALSSNSTAALAAGAKVAKGIALTPLADTPAGAPDADAAATADGSGGVVPPPATAAAAAATESSEVGAHGSAAGGVSGEADVRIPVTRATMHNAAALFSARPRPGCVVPAAGYPTLHTLSFTPQLEAVSMNVFGMASKKDSLVLAVGGEGRKRKRRQGGDDDDGDADDEEEDDEDDGVFLAAAGAFGDNNGSSSDVPVETEGSDSEPSPLGGKRLAALPGVAHRRPLLLRAHVPSFSTAYAEGTTVAALRSGTPPREDFLSTWLAEQQQRGNSGGGGPPTARAIASSLLGRVLYVEWPHLREALITGVSDAVDEAEWTGDAANAHGHAPDPRDISVRPHSPDDAIEWSKAARGIENDLLAGRRALGLAGIRIGAVHVIVTARKLVGMRRDPASGSLSRVWAAPRSFGEVRVVPDLVLAANPAPDPRFAESGPLSPAQRFPVGTTVVCLRGLGRGCLATVTGHHSHASLSSSPRLTLDLSVEVAVPEPPFGHSIASTIKDTYFDSRRTCDALGLTPGVLGRITGSVIVNPGKIDLGLNLKVRRTLYLPGYVRSMSAEARAPAWCAGGEESRAIAASHGSGGNGGGGGGPSGPWEYTERAMHLIAAYQRAFPLVFALLESQPDEPFYESRSFPGKLETVTRVATWLQQLDTYKRPLVPLSTQFMCGPAIAAAEKAADTFNAQMLKRAGGVKPTTTTPRTDVSPADVFCPEVFAYAVGSIGEGAGTALVTTNVDGGACIPLLGDRITNLSYRQAPLGVRGTVVAVHTGSGFVEVVFDAEFIGGSTLGGLCSNGRGALVPWSSLLCLSRTPEQSSAAAAASSPSAAARSSPGGGQADDGGDDDELARLMTGPRGKRGVVGGGGKGASPAGAVRTPALVTPTGILSRSPAGGGGGGGGSPAVVRKPAQQPLAPFPDAAGQSLAAGRNVSVRKAATTPTRPMGVPAAASPARQPVAPPPQRQAHAPPAAAPHGAEDTAPDLSRIASQVDFYFGDANLVRDAFLRERVESDPKHEGWVDVSLLSSFPRLVALAGGNSSLIAVAVAQCSKMLVVSSDRKYIRRVVPWAPAAAAAAAGTAAARPIVVAPSSSPAGARPSSVADLFAAAAASAAAGQASPSVSTHAGGAGVSGGGGAPHTASGVRVEKASSLAHARPVAAGPLVPVAASLAPAPAVTSSAKDVVVTHWRQLMASTAAGGGQQQQQPLPSSAAAVTVAPVQSAHVSSSAATTAPKEAEASGSHFAALLSNLRLKHAAASAKIATAVATAPPQQQQQQSHAPLPHQHQHRHHHHVHQSPQPPRSTSSVVPDVPTPVAVGAPAEVTTEIASQKRPGLLMPAALLTKKVAPAPAPAPAPSSSQQ